MNVIRENIYIEGYPYGKILREFNPKAEKYLTTHHERDTETGLDYRGARYYDADVARFLSLDPKAKDYPVYSDYCYVVGNPIRFIDKDGRLVTDENGNVVFTPHGKPTTITHPSGAKGKVQMGYVTGNDGTQIIAYQNVSSNKGFDTDCHGQTFSDGQTWINNDQVDALLKADGYTEVQDITYVKENDVVVYRNAKTNDVEHSATVVSTAKGNVQVEGLGGVQTKTSKQKVGDAWKKGAKQTYYRKSDKQKATDKGVSTDIRITKQDNNKREPVKGIDF